MPLADRLPEPLEHPEERLAASFTRRREILILGEAGEMVAGDRAERITAVISQVVDQSIRHLEPGGTAGPAAGVGAVRL